MAIRPTLGMSIAGISALPPAASIDATAASTSSTLMIAEPGRTGAVLLHLVGQRQDSAGEAAVARVPIIR